MKRESGVNPERCSHCVRERRCKPLGNREGQRSKERSQETCLGVESRIRCPRVGLPASLYGLPLWKTTFDTAREVEEKLILANPAKKCKIPKNTRKEMNILPEALIGPYLSAAKEHGILAPMYLELTTGLRRGELLALRWEDLDIQNHTLSINKSVARQNGKLVISTPKTPNSIRTVLLPTDTVKLLVEEHEKHPANPYLFPSPRTGETWDPDGFRRLHDRIVKEIGAEHVRFHDMRHTFATLSLKSGVDVRTLSETLGHFSAGFTLSTYVHSTPGMKQSAADAIGNTIRNAI